MNKVIVSIVLLAIFAASYMNKIDEFVLKTLHEKRTTTIVINLSKQAEFDSPLLSKLDVMDKSLRGWLVLDMLMNVAKDTQQPIKEYLEKRHLKYESFWVQNSIVVYNAPADVIFELAKRDDVGRIFTGEELPSPTLPTEEKDINTKSFAPEWNVAYIRAPELWARGFEGQNIVVGGLDTGVDYSHPALRQSYRGNKGGNFDHNYNWIDGVTNFTNCGRCGCDSKVPCDDGSHGTHTMGTVAGGVDRQIGVAPKAKWIACRGFSNNWSPQTFLRCFQFFIAPTDLNGKNPNPDLRPHITTHSWGCTRTLPRCPTPDEMKPAVDAMRAAGMMTVVAAGNEGSSCSTLRWPGIYESVWTVGALDRNSSNIAYFSSRGPVTIDGSNRRKPDISAPGVSVVSSVPGGRYSTMSGTSMATPAVAGAVALLWSAVPSLERNIEKTREIFEKSAEHQTSNLCNSPQPTPNNVYGYGTINVIKAYELAKSLGY